MQIKKIFIIGKLLLLSIFITYLNGVEVNIKAGLPYVDCRYKWRVC